ncbi:hypothetical protein OIU81_03115 [Streptomyces sp. NBC_01454]|uniref:hypothetical protein n=1 Tax=Streptomyces sp. NBC_01454 TaxID=2975867 RepID=UPI002E32ACFE|nr:hypothetical protein [Streptomyces sp. NBC_01454]
MFPQEVRTSPVREDGKKLTVSTVKIAHRRYSTVVFDDHSDRRHAGKRIGRHIIGTGEVRSDTREEAMDAHREALQAARSEVIR